MMGKVIRFRHLDLNHYDRHFQSHFQTSVVTRIGGRRVELLALRAVATRAAAQPFGLVERSAKSVPPAGRGRSSRSARTATTEIARHFNSHFRLSPRLTAGTIVR
jgi:hypothetical protein